MIDDNRRPVDSDGLPSARRPEKARPAAQGAASSWFLAADDLRGSRLAAPGRSGPLPAERVAEIRLGIVRGAYDTPEVLAVVARRMLARGDLRLGR